MQNDNKLKPSAHALLMMMPPISEKENTIQKVQNCLHFLIPKFLLVAIYWMFFWLIRILVLIKFNHRVQIWPRNSLVLKYLEPPFSDIDLTLYSPNSNPKEIQEGLQFIGKIKKVLPVIGEVNSYLLNDLKDFLSIANPVEAQRDPILCQKFQLGDKPSLADKLAFLVKQIEGNFFVLQSRPKTRYRKFKHHFQELLDMEIKRDQMDPNTLLEMIQKNLNLNSNFSQDLISYLRFQSLDVPLNQMPDSIFQSAWCWAFFPNRLCFRDLQACLSDFQEEIFISNIGWEIWGLGTQMQLSAPETQNHLRNLLRVTDQLCTQASKENSFSFKLQKCRELLSQRIGY